MFPMIKAIFFDNDGVLVDTEPLYFEATRLALEEYGVELTKDFYVNEHLKRNTSTFEPAKRKGFSEEQIDKIRDRRYEIYLGFLKTRVPPINGVSEALEQLYGKVKMGVVTSSMKWMMDEIFQANGLRKFFDFVVTIEDVKHGKPHPDPYLKAVKISGLKPAECLVIEDTERGVTAAKAAGLRCFAVPTELSAENDFSKADRVLKNLGELPPIVLSGAGRQN